MATYQSKRPYAYGTGRRKSSTARVHLIPNGIGSITINMTGLAVASIVGIVLNAVLPGKDYHFAEEPDETLASSLGKY